jgi:hypothetical protein
VGSGVTAGETPVAVDVDAAVQEFGDGWCQSEAVLAEEQVGMGARVLQVGASGWEIRLTVP